MRICAGITYMVLGEAPDMSSVDDEVRQHWNSLSIETARREAQRHVRCTVARAGGGVVPTPGITVIDAPGDKLRCRDTRGAPHPGLAPSFVISGVFCPG